MNTMRYIFASVAVAALAGCEQTRPAVSEALHTHTHVSGQDVCVAGVTCATVPPATPALPVALPDPGIVPPAPPVVPTLPLPPLPPPLGGPPPPPPPPNYTVAMQVLVLSADGKEATLGAIKDALGYHTINYTVWIGSQNPGMLTADKLATGSAGKYQAVILADGSLAYSPDGGLTWTSALTPTEWQTLRSYEAQFHVRELAWYVYPNSDWGLNTPSGAVDTTSAPINATLTAAGQSVFSYVNTANPITISLAYTYLTTPADPNVTPLLVDSANHALISTRKTADGRETMALTFDSNQYLIHDLILQHGLVEWATKGLYLGEYRTYLTPQIDDLFIPDDMYNAAAYPGGTFRMSSSDFLATHAWQVGLQQTLGGNSGFRLCWAFNGVGASDTDDLTIAAQTFSGDYHWISHTWDHENLDALTYDQGYMEFSNNIQLARHLGLKNFYAANLISPDVSGLTNPAVLQAAVDNGIGFMVSDTSKESGKGSPQAGWNNPAPNIGIYSIYQPSILFIPRRPTNLYYNVSTPAEWTGEYNAFYTTYWGRALTYQEVLDKESQFLFMYMLRGDIDPQMYHQPNTRAYDGVHTLLGDLHDMAIQKFRKYSTLPVMSPDQQVAGARIANTMARNSAGVTGAIAPGSSVSFTSPSTVDFAVSGVCTSNSEKYAGKCITTVHVNAGTTVTLPIQ